jgi:hypothetical protein
MAGGCSAFISFFYDQTDRFGSRRRGELWEKDNHQRADYKGIPG